MSKIRRSFAVVPAAVAALVLGSVPGFAQSAVSAPRASSAGSAVSADDAPPLLNRKGEAEGEEEAGFDKLRDAYFWSRLLSGDDSLSVAQAAKLRLRASQQASRIDATDTRGKARGGTWATQGPNPIVQVVRTSNTFAAMAGRIGALVIRRNGTIILGAAQGGVWTYAPGAGVNGTWRSRTRSTDTQAVGALALAPSNDRIVYMGSGEGSLSGDSYYGDGIYRSADGGKTWTHVSSAFTGQAVTDIVVDPRHPNHLFASTVRGRGGAHRTTSPTDRAYGVSRSNDGGRTWTLLKGTKDELHGATDLVMDPQHPDVLWASFWGDGIYRSTDSGRTWKSALGDLPEGNFVEGGTRFSLGLSHPADARTATVYAGFDYFDAQDTYHPAQIWKTTSNGTTWTLATGSTTGADSPTDYCGTQCFYDNEVKPDPDDPNTVYALGSYGYDDSPQSGGVYR
ncbi:MAG: hypothetical protein ABI776_18490, partial [Nocardioidaceae bacterium]